MKKTKTSFLGEVDGVKYYKGFTGYYYISTKHCIFEEVKQYVDENSLTLTNEYRNAIALDYIYTNKLNRNKAYLRVADTTLILLLAGVLGFNIYQFTKDKKSTELVFNGSEYENEETKEQYISRISDMVNANKCFYAEDIQDSIIKYVIKYLDTMDPTYEELSNIELNISTFVGDPDNRIELFQHVFGTADESETWDLLEWLETAEKVEYNITPVKELK